MAKGAAYAASMGKKFLVATILMDKYLVEEGNIGQKKNVGRDE